MRFAPVLLVLALLAAGCLEETTEPNDDVTPSSTPTPTIVPSPSPSPSPSPAASPAPTPTPAPTPVATSLSIQTLASGSNAGSQTHERVVITDEAAYAAFWQRVREDDQKSAPPVDLSAKTVIGVVDGPRSNTCWSLRVTAATDDGQGRTHVEVTTYTPPPDLMCGQAITHPWHIVAIEGAGRSVTFVEREMAGPSPG